ncbi:MAG: Bro-N domain-containing protein [Bacilli bacterium]|nr:Bro-N domain-containing protein [Bacilli bacterium]
MQEKLKTISKLFEGNEIRSIWDSEKEEYYFSVVDVIRALTDSTNPNDYWYRLKKRMTDEEKSEISTKCRQLKMSSKKDGKNYLTDTLDTKGILRLIESVPSPKAEPFKLWLANLGSERVDEVFDPSIGIDKMIDFYLHKGYTLEWIELRIKAIINRKKLTKVWNDGGIKESKEYAILTNEIYKTWSGMTASEYKKFKNIRKENLRDNMTDVEVALADLGELATREIAKKKNPKGLKENIDIARCGGEIASNTKKNLEAALGDTVITNKNALNYKYINDLEE